MKPMPRRLAAAVGAVVLAASFATTAAAVDPDPSSTSLSVNSVTQEHHPLVLTAVVSPATAGFDTDATIDFVDANLSGDDCLNVPVDPGNVTTCLIDLPHVGDHSYTATYSGNTTLAGSVSDPATDFTVVADTVDATGVGVNYGTFYPVKDKYKDTLKISGNRQELIAVTIRIYNSKDKRVALVTKPQATGGYSFSWNGKVGKKVLPAGKYRIVQTLVDSAGTTKVVTKYANLSHKKLVTVTRTISKNGAAVAAGTIGHIYKAGHAAHIKAGSSGAVAGWQFKIPSAISYKSITFRANVAAHLAAPPSLIAMQNFNICTGWDAGCVDRIKAIGNSSGSAKWYSTKGSPSPHRNGRIVRGLAGVGTGSIYVYKVQVKVTYTVLK